MQSNLYLYRNYKMAGIFQKLMSVDCDDTSLIGLGNVSEYGVHHT